MSRKLSQKGNFAKKAPISPKKAPTRQKKRPSRPKKRPLAEISAQVASKLAIRRDSLLGRRDFLFGKVSGRQKEHPFLVGIYIGSPSQPLASPASLGAFFGEWALFCLFWSIFPQHAQARGELGLQNRSLNISSHSCPKSTNLDSIPG